MMTRTDAHEFRLRIRLSPEEPYGVGIYHCTDGIETGDVLYYHTKQDLIEAVETLRKQIDKMYPE